MIQRYTLQNGLRVIIEDIPTVRSVALGIWIGTGSRNETLENNGISHFIEHMLFKGTKNRTAQEIAEVFDSIGGNVNAFTSKEYTCYYAKVLDEHVELGLDVLSDMFFHSTFDKDELDRERKVIIEEIKMYEDTPDDQVHDLIAKASHGEHPLGYTILGTEEILNSITFDSIEEYLNKRYTVENTVLTIAGNIPKDILAIVEKYFGQFNHHGEQQTERKASFQPSEVIKSKQTEQAHLTFALPGLPVTDPDIYSLILLNNIIGGSMSSRFFQEIREKRGLAYSVFSYHTSYKDTGLFTIYAGTAPNQVNDVVDLIQLLLVEIKQNGITEKEINKGKEQLKGNLMLSLESTNSRMSRLGKNELLLGKHLSLDEMIQKIDQVTHDSIQRIISKVFHHPFAFSMISPLDQLPQTYRRDLLVSN
ncbi:M16 family metallopeptidase [Tepidibacillus fermentans]|uniref:Putative Zn-dependent peptidase n=1 Tax=Tepidibacillus fermentans TaxID=1281767 RepID=A0A4V2USV7_9BACI|nr:pitrilysin family protein [Tepidibacillus fermentans]TCS82993.1 putative Zn-dependent peptidase [Tepidibacillus fermentans]